MEEPKKYKLPHVAFDSLIEIKVSGAFLKRCQILLIHLGEQLGKDKLKLLYEKFKNTAEGASDANEEIIFILTALVSEIEKSAIDQKKVKETEFTQEQIDKLFGEKSTS